MRLENFLSEEAILVRVSVSDKEQLFDIMAEVLSGARTAVSAGLDFYRIKEAILKRKSNLLPELEAVLPCRTRDFRN